MHSSIFFNVRIIALTVLVSLLVGCVSRSRTPPMPVMPATPNEFLTPLKEPSDRSLNCSALQQKVRYTRVMIETVDRVFNSKAPMLMQESTYSSTNGVMTSSGGFSNAHSTTRTFGGGSVYVYSDLSYRAKKINDAQQARQNELKYLIKFNGCISELTNSGSEDYSHYIKEAERDLRSKQQDYQQWLKAVTENQDLHIRADKPETKRMWADNTKKFILLRDEAKAAVDAAQFRRDTLVDENKEAYARAETAVVQMRKWFEENTKLP